MNPIKGEPCSSPDFLFSLEVLEPMGFLILFTSYLNKVHYVVWYSSPNYTLLIEIPEMAFLKYPFNSCDIYPISASHGL